MKTTLVLGASPNPERYSYKAVCRLKEHGHPVIAVGNKQGTIGDIKIDLPENTGKLSVDTISLYLNPAMQKKYYEYILNISPQRIIFNPGTENSELRTLAEKKGIITEEACTLVLLSIGAY